MNSYKPSPGVSRDNRISVDGLERLQKQLTSGSRMADMVLAQWIRRYGDPARELIREHDRYIAEFDAIKNQP